MFCPKCSQSQPSEEMRFCSRCGFPLGTVSLLLGNEGTLPELDNSANRLSIRSRMATESLILLVLSWAIGLVCTFWFNAHGIYEGIAKIGAFTFFMLGFIGLFRFLYAFLFVKITQTTLSKDPSALKEAIRSQLPPPQMTPISDWPLRPNTREMVSQPSVTEHTTRLLDDE